MGVFEWYIQIGMALGKKWFALNESIGTISVHEV